MHRKRHARRSFIRSFCVCLDGLPDRIQNPSAAARGGESFSLTSAFPFFFLKLSRMSLTRRKSNMAPSPQGWGCHVGLPDRIQNPSAAARGGESFSLTSAFPFFFLKLSRMSLTRRKSNMAPSPQGWGCHVGLPDRIQNPSAAARGGESFSLTSAFPFFFLKLSRMSLTRRKSNMAPPPQGWGRRVWPTRQDSNLRPRESESRALSSWATGRLSRLRDR